MKTRDEIYIELVPLLEQGLFFKDVWEDKKIIEVINKIFNYYVEKNKYEFLENNIFSDDLMTFFEQIRRPYLKYSFTMLGTKYDTGAVKFNLSQSILEIIRILNLKVSQKDFEHLNTVILLGSESNKLKTPRISTQTDLDSYPYFGGL